MNTSTAASRDKSHGTIVKRVSKKGHDEAHGGAWKVAFADFVLALMCLFLVLWILAARDSEEAAKEVRRAAGGKMFEDGGSMVAKEPRTLGSMIPREPVPAQNDALQPRKAFTNGDTQDKREAQGAAPRLYQSTTDLRQLSMTITHLAQDAGLLSNLQSVITPYGLRVMLHDTDRVGMFERGSAYPSERFRGLLRSLGPLLADVENQILVVGHTDSVPFSNSESYPSAISNWTLSNNRAMAARFHMMVGGMPSRSTLQVVGMADRAPVDVGHPEAGVNRRIELMVLTPEHAQAIAAMFGPPSPTAPTNTIAPGLDVSLPDRTVLESLRQRLSVR